MHTASRSSRPIRSAISRHVLGSARHSCPVPLHISPILSFTLSLSWSRSLSLLFSSLCRPAQSIAFAYALGSTHALFAKPRSTGPRARQLSSIFPFSSVLLFTSSSRPSDETRGQLSGANLTRRVSQPPLNVAKLPRDAQCWFVDCQKKNNNRSLRLLYIAS
ncbi:unnamed protein product [Protopolystoma xenopodis]|uniref:Uncharacterized protein n=1 Tax=Protopolystoma xenopodis TaxID=117903 RepID=A0A448XR07_9PLAT|nr:unnamed protein product [Protopolystoma xenopodis]